MPVIQVSSGPSNPRAAPVYRSKWVKRYYLSSGLKATVAGALPLTWANITNLPNPTTIIVDKITVWQLNYISANNPGLQASLNAGTFVENSTGAVPDNPVGQDFGTANSLPSITFKMPAGHTKAISATGVGVIATVQNAEVGDYFACAVEGWVQI